MQSDGEEERDEMSPEMLEDFSDGILSAMGDRSGNEDIEELEEFLEMKSGDKSLRAADPDDILLDPDSSVNIS